MARESMRQIMSDADSNAIKPRIVANNTIEYHMPNGEKRIRLHHTDIIYFLPNGDIRLNTGGWQTVTTKDRLNGFSPARIYSENGIWYCNYMSKEYPYQDGIILHENGTVSNAGPDPKDTQKLRKKVRQYAKEYIKALREGKVSKPSNGDCWGCLMTTKDGKHPMGGADHIISHMEEKYYVPSLLVNAFERFGASKAMRHNIACIWENQPDKLWNMPYLWESSEKMVRRWCYQELGLSTQ